MPRSNISDNPIFFRYKYVTTCRMVLRQISAFIRLSRPLLQRSDPRKYHFCKHLSAYKSHVTIPISPVFFALFDTLKHYNWTSLWAVDTHSAAYSCFPLTQVLSFMYMYYFHVNVLWNLAVVNNTKAKRDSSVQQDRNVKCLPPSTSHQYLFLFTVKHAWRQVWWIGWPLDWTHNAYSRINP